MRRESWLRGMVLLSLFSVMNLSSCSATRKQGWIELEARPSESEQTLHIAGIVRHVDLEGGLFVIRDAQGVQHNPINLPEAFRRNGLAVEAQARRSENMASIGMIGTLVQLLRIRKRPGDTMTASGLWGTSWRLEDLAGAGVLDAVQATLAFPEEGKVQGSGSCNRFHGTVTIRGDSITVGPLLTTRRSCVEAVMNQENRYLAALREAARFEIKEPFLFLHPPGGTPPLRFIREE